MWLYQPIDRSTKLRPIAYWPITTQWRSDIRSDMPARILASAAELCRKALESPLVLAHTCVVGGAYWIGLLLLQELSKLFSKSTGTKFSFFLEKIIVTRKPSRNVNKLFAWLVCEPFRCIYKSECKTQVTCKDSIYWEFSVQIVTIYMYALGRMLHSAHQADCI